MSNTNKAFLFSVALHVALLAGLGMLRPRFDPGVGASARYLEIAITEAVSDAATQSSARPAADNADDSTPEQTTSEPPPAVETAAVANEAPVEPPSLPSAPEAAQQPNSTPPLPDSPPPTELIASAAASPAVIAVTTPAAGSALTLAASAAEQQSPDPATESEPIATAEAALLEARIEDWAERFAALGEFAGATTWDDGDAVYEATVAHEPSPDGSGYDEAVVTVSTKRDGKTLSTRVRMQRLGFSHYAQFIDRWDPAVQIHDDEIDGRFHANSDIFIQRSGGVQPTFLGKVTTARSIDTSYSDLHVRRDQVFLGGVETRVGRIPLPARAAPFGNAEPDAAAVLELEHDTELRFLADGSFRWTRLLSRREQRQLENGDQPAGITASAEAGTGMLPADGPFYILANQGARLHVAGVVNGRVLVYSQEDIVIDDDLVYAEHPTQSTASDDFLGLVAEGSVAIADASTTGPGDLEVHAAIYARSRFAVRGFRSKPSGELKVVGSITAGSLTATEPRFSTRLVFDRRLAENRPPAFPVTDRYEIADWDAAWIVEP